VEHDLDGWRGKPPWLEMGVRWNDPLFSGTVSCGDEKDLELQGLVLFRAIVTDLGWRRNPEREKRADITDSLEHNLRFQVKPHVS